MYWCCNCVFSKEKNNLLRMIISVLTAVSYCQLRFMNNNDKFDVTENRIISGRLIWLHPKRQICFPCRAIHLSLVLRINEKRRVSADQSTDAVYWCIANFPICYSLNIRYTYTHNEYRAAKHKQNNPPPPQTITHSPTHTCCFSPVLFRYKFCLEKYQLLGGSLCLCLYLWLIRDSGAISLMLSTKTVEKKVSNPTKVCLITNYWPVLKTNISTRLYSHLYSSRNVFPGKVSREREEDERNRRKKLTQPKQKKIVTRKLSNKVSQLLADFLCTDKLTNLHTRDWRWSF